MRTYVKPERPKRHLVQKACDRCGETKNASEYPKVRGGGTADICNECKRKAVSEGVKAKHSEERAYRRYIEEEHVRRVTGASGPPEIE